MAATVIGPASATGAVSLAVHGQSVRLYGVLPPGDADRCVSLRGSATSCADVTREVLSERLAKSASVTCRLPPHVRSDEPARICLDGSGVDIAGYLVAEGLALADPRQARDYVGAEGIAKSYRKGLWAYR
jgi:endonuclease YncB( thermonuclease family)